MPEGGPLCTLCSRGAAHLASQPPPASSGVSAWCPRRFWNRAKGPTSSLQKIIQSQAEIPSCTVSGLELFCKKQIDNYAAAPEIFPLLICTRLCTFLYKLLASPWLLIHSSPSAALAPTTHSTADPRHLPRGQRAGQCVHASRSRVSSGCSTPGFSGSCSSRFLGAHPLPRDEPRR